MEHERSNLELEGWTEEDFSDPTSSKDLQQDPWELRLVNAEDKADSPSGQVQVAASFEEAAALFQSAPDEIVGAQDPVGSTVGPDSYDGEFDSQETEYLTETVPFLEWDEEPLDGDEPNAPFFIDGDSYDDRENDVVPLADYQSDLREALYELGGNAHDWARSIRIDEFISRVEDISAPQEQEISELLLSLSAPRLSRWLPWMRSRGWTGRTLLLFLQFRVFWDENSEFWAFLRWSPVANYWLTMLNRNSMSLDDSYLLVQRRSEWPAYRLIDPDWFDDWDQIDVWARVTEGFFSFASFTMYRCRLSYGEDWRCRPDLKVDLDSAPLSSVVDRHGWELLLHTDWARLSFEGENGTDPVDWHGGLGW